MFRRYLQSSSVRNLPESSLQGLNWALAAKGVIVKEKALLNLNSTQLYLHGAKTLAEPLSGLPVYVRGSFTGEEAPKISKAQFSKLLKQVTNHISNESNVFVHDGAVGSSSLKAGAKVRVISDSASAVLALSSVLWGTPTHAVSHDSHPLTIYAATCISGPEIGNIIGLDCKTANGLIAADVERSSLVLCGNAFSDSCGIKQALAALSGPVISARRGLALSARILVFGDSVLLLFASEDAVRSCGDLLVPGETCVILSSEGVSPTRSCGGSNLFKLPAAVVLATFDSSGVIPSVSRLGPGQAAYHFLAGYQNGKFMPAYSTVPSSIDLLELAKELMYQGLGQLKGDRISFCLVNAYGDGKAATGFDGDWLYSDKLIGCDVPYATKDFAKLMESILSKNILPFEVKMWIFKTNTRACHEQIW